MTLDPKLTKFTTASPIIASYPAADLAEGNSKVNFFGFTTIDDATTSYNLSTNSIFSYTITTGTGNISTTGTFVKKLDLDLDTSPFNLQKFLDGTAIVNISFSVGDAGAGGNHGFAYVIVKLRKWDGTIETEIASAQTQTIESTGGPGTTVGTAALKLPVSPGINFAAGEQIRLTLEGWLKSSSGGVDKNMDIAHDPKNRDSGSFTASVNPTRLDLFAPFRIDL